MSDLKIGGNEAVLSFGDSLEEIDKLLIVWRFAHPLHELRDVADTTSPWSIDVTQLRLDQVPRVPRRVIWKALAEVIGLARIWSLFRTLVQDRLEQVEVGLDRLVGSSFDLANIVNAKLIPREDHEATVALCLFPSFQTDGQVRWEVVWSGRDQLRFTRWRAAVRVDVRSSLIQRETSERHRRDLTRLRLGRRTGCRQQDQRCGGRDEGSHCAVLPRS